MIPRIPIATYRIQLRGGVGFAQVQRHLPYFRRLGVSHLYLSPIFAAARESSHGYDIIDPTRIDPLLGGRAGFEAMARAAISHGLGIILDIVPNHTAFSPQNPWLLDVLRHGRESRHAARFDIDWSAGPLVLPFLPEPFEKMLADGAFHVADGMWCFGETRLPLAQATGNTKSPSDLRALHEAQHWRLVHADQERDGITHRRFFNVTSLIGMRVEDETVFQATHGLIFDLVRAGLVHGLRVDHIDGLADPAAYLRALRRALPDTPVWVEKILVGDETLPAGWATEGTTGYEAARLLARLLTDADGLDRLDANWRAATGIDSDFRQELTQAKQEVLDNELAAERRQLRDMAAIAAQGSQMAQPGPESLREAVTALLVAMPRYRSYVTGAAEAEDRRLLAAVAETAAAGPRSRAVLDLLVALILDPPTAAAKAFAIRFQQVSGALLAKAQEDTAGFRWPRYLAANEVGAEPDAASVTDAAANLFLSQRAGTAMTLVSSHDTKRSADSRMRLAAISHLPETFHQLYAAALTLPQAQAADPRWLWYGVQSALAIWDGDAQATAARLDTHIEKAMREAKLTSFWTNPDTAAEDAVKAFCRALLTQWRDPNPRLQALLVRGRALGLAQLAFQMLMPGFPDVYRGDETTLLALTDPDNRRPVAWDSLDAGLGRDIKSQWTAELLALRRKRAAFLTTAAARIERGPDRLRLIREGGGQRLMAQISFGAGAPSASAFLAKDFADGTRVSLHDLARSAPAP